jgi:Ca-activated chloride channel homolog
MSWRLADAWLLACLAPVYLLALGLWLRHRRARRLAAFRPALPHATLPHAPEAGLAALPPTWRTRARPWAEGLRWLTVALLLLSLARPQTLHAVATSTQQGLAILLVLDTSSSMQARDLDPERPILERRDRLEVAKDVVGAFVERRRQDAIGLVVFGEEAFTQCPLTTDHDIVLRLLERVRVGAAGTATAIGTGLAMAIKRVKDSPAATKLIVLATDGRNNAGALSPEQTAEIARALGIKVYTVGLGSQRPAPILERTLFGSRIVHQKLDLDEKTLQRIADTTGGRYFRAEDSRELARVYADIDRLETSELAGPLRTEARERFAWPALVALGLLAVELLLTGTVLRTLP